MSLQWSFKEKAGAVTENREGREITLPFYEGNALMIVPYEYEEDGKEFYNMQWFFLDEYHAKNCLGLAKGHDNMFGADGIIRLTIYRDRCTQWQKLVTLFTRAFPKIAVEILASDPTAE